MIAVGFAVGVWSLLAFCRISTGLWENPPDGRFSRQRRAGVFHRACAWLVCEVCYWWFEFFVGVCGAFIWAYNHGLWMPRWFLNYVPYLVMPFKAARVIGARESLRRSEVHDA